MQRQILLTNDGSHTVSVPEMDVTYHSKHGALQESIHIYIGAGFRYCLPNITGDEIRVFEMGFGTGLNALLTLQEATKLKRKVYYHAVELFPLTMEEAKTLDYDALLDTGNLAIKLHDASWEEGVSINEYFILHKTKQSLVNVTLKCDYNIIYFDAFAPTIQPDLWTQEVFEHLYKHSAVNGVLVTYSSKVSVRKALEAAGFCVEKLRGPIGKAEIVRAKRS